MIISVDLDGVYYDFYKDVKDALVEEGQEYLWKSGHKQPHWNFYEDWGWTYDDFNNFCNHAVSYGDMFRHNWYPHAKPVLSKLYGLLGNNDTLRIVTARGYGLNGQKDSERNTKESLANHEIPFDDLFFTADKASVEMDLMVDDSGPNVLSLLESGVECYLLKRSWNKSHQGIIPKSRQIERVEDYLSIVARRVC